MDRRRFLQASSLTGGALLLPGLGTAPALAGRRAALPHVRDPLYLTPIIDPAAVPRFRNELPRPPRIDLLGGGERTVVMAATRQDVIGGGLGLTTPVWGFGERGGRVSYPGPTLVAHRDRPVTVEWVNSLPTEHLLPVDTTIHWAFAGTDRSIAGNGVPTVVHLHGGHTDAGSDGHPDSWYTPDGSTGPRYEGRRFRYDNSQEAATLWYHDHTAGLTRLNVYAGLAGSYLLRDRRELELIDENHLPRGPYELELLIQDRMFHPDGRLAYPDAPADHREWPGGPSIRQDFFGRVIVVNGKAWPYVEVEPRQYRLRLVNGSNSRFYRLSAGGRWPFAVTQIGADSGFLYRPQRLDGPVTIAPGERLDLVVDFRGHAGRTHVLTNNAPTPFPFGPPAGPPADQVLQFRVTRPYDRQVPEPRLPYRLRSTPYLITRPPARTRRLQLFERRDRYGRPKPMFGTVERGPMAWTDPVTEDPSLGTTEIWEIFNTTGHTHPIHLHLVQFKVLDRARFTGERDPRTGGLTDIRIEERRSPDATEEGPKDTVMVHPGEVTRIKALFDKRGLYVWHCHILEHEEYDMMRSYRVV